MFLVGSFPQSQTFSSILALDGKRDDEVALFVGKVLLVFLMIAMFVYFFKSIQSCQLLIGG